MHSREEARRYHPVSAPDYVPRDHLRGLQLERLRRVVRRAFDRLAPFRERLRERGLEPDDLRTPEDLARLPFTERADLAAAGPLGGLAVPREEVVLLHPSGGGEAGPGAVAFTRGDLVAWGQVVERALAACGLRRGDRVLNAHAHGLDAVALGTHFRGEELGVAVIPSCGGGTDRHVALLQDLGVAAVWCTPGYFLHLVERGRELSADFPALRVALLGAEPWSEALRRRIESDTRVRAYDLLGTPEVGGPGVGVECAAQSGLHLLEDHWYPEVVDPATGAVLPDGVEGELVLTTLTREAQPLVRFRTRALTAFIPEPCACGRTLRRVRRVRRRSDDVLSVRGVSVYPGQVETALLAVEGTLPHFQIVLRGAPGLDELEVRVEVTPAVFSDQVRALSALREKLESALGHTLGLRVRATLVGPHTLQRSAGPVRRVVDERNP